jgi:hypothetical protein
MVIHFVKVGIVGQILHRATRSAGKSIQRQFFVRPKNTTTSHHGDTTIVVTPIAILLLYSIALTMLFTFWMSSLLYQYHQQSSLMRPSRILLQYNNHKTEAHHDGLHENRIVNATNIYTLSSSLLDYGNSTSQDFVTPMRVPSVQPARNTLLLPPWMQQYLVWHGTARQNLISYLHSVTFHDSSNGTATHRPLNCAHDTPQRVMTPPPKILLIRCLPAYDWPCGGVADRLASLPWAMMMAAYTQRLLLLHWEHPIDTRLTDFLQPPPILNWQKHSNFTEESFHYTLDWTVPHVFLKQHTFRTCIDASHQVYRDLFTWQKRPAMLRRLIEFQSRQLVPSSNDAFLAGKYVSSTMDSHNVDRNYVVDIRLPSYREARKAYDSVIAADEPDFWHIQRTLWQVMFQPSSPVAQELQRQRQHLFFPSSASHDISLNSFAIMPFRVAHARTRYNKSQKQRWNNLKLQNLVQNAISCAAISASNSDWSKHESTSRKLIVWLSDDDTGQTLKHAQNTTTLYKVVAPLYAHTPWHLDRGPDYFHDVRLSANGMKSFYNMSLPYSGHSDESHIGNAAAKPYYSIFVDLFLMYHAECVSFDVGGFGRLGRSLSRNPDCGIRHKTTKCSNHTLLPLKSFEGVIAPYRGP